MMTIQLQLHQLKMKCYLDMEVTKVAIVDITEADEEVEEVDTRNTIVKMTRKMIE